MGDGEVEEGLVGVGGHGGGGDCGGGLDGQVGIERSRHDLCSNGGSLAKFRHM